MHTDGNVHRLCGRRDDGPNNERNLPHHSHLLSPEEIGQRADEGAKSGIGNEVRNDEPDPTVHTADVRVDERQDGAKEEERDLRANPQEGHAYQGHEEPGIHLTGCQLPF
jgi:hypothetical protein